MTPRSEASFPNFKFTRNDIEIEFDFELLEQQAGSTIDSRLKEINEKKQKVEKKLKNHYERLAELDAEIHKLNNHSDGLDYLLAIGSGVVAALIDSFWVGDFNLKRGRDWGSEKVNEFVLKVAHSQGYKGDDLKGAIHSLEGKFGLASDSNTSEFGGGLQHHLRDFAHHPTIVGLIFSLLTQFTGKSYGTDKDGHFLVVEVKNEKFIGDDLPQKIMFGFIFWFFHMVSDIAGSSSNLGEGTGLPGPFLSLIKELAVPIIVNECLVRGIYFIRRFFEEIKEKNISTLNDLKLIELEKVLPVKNRTIVRMLTISTGTFTALDLCDAAIRGAIQSKGSAAFFKEFIVKVNIVGIGRFAFATGTDIYMGNKNHNLKQQKMKQLNELLHDFNANIYYTQAEMWIEADNTENMIHDVLNQMEQTTMYYIDTFEKNKESLRNIGQFKQNIEKHNPKLIKDILDVMKWGNVNGRKQ
ncbi:hypothetical protein [Bacillus altitudinis]|uniref:hypothetical protein n=1 Tax=Bacillus altitudinis TaxID=293387 RepID=UPI0011B664C3|nr:hypothetical protein [Bacillus altitudinis]QDZ96316.1 hypothetical protein D0438_15595 [Bacillus altitudinis]